MATHLTFLCHGATRSMREGGFPAADESLDEGGARKIAQAPPSVGQSDFAISSPAAIARETAAALGLTVTIDERLRDMDAGQWAGKTFEQVGEKYPDAFAAWLAEPEQGAPKGERMADVRIRAEDWLAEQIGASHRVTVITHPMVIRAALSACLDLPFASVMRFDIAPLSTAALSYNRVWRLQSIGPSRTQGCPPPATAADIRSDQKIEAFTPSRKREP